jgi:hypothetical protein
MVAKDPKARLTELRGGAKERSPNVRALARFAATSQCRMASLGFAARVDFDQLLVRTKFEVPYGQSPFAFRRGEQFEERLRKDNHKPMLELLGSTLGYDVSTARPVNLRKGFQPNRDGMAKRAVETARLIAEIVAGKKDAPNLIDGAVLARQIGGIAAHFEADTVAARFEDPIHAGEVKSFPTVDGQADADKVGAAIAQVSIYVLLLRELVEKMGGKPELVSGDALIITPKNTGLQPTMVRKAVGREVDRADRILRLAPTAAEIVGEIPDDVPTFGQVAAKSSSEAERIEHAECLVERVGNHYQAGCLSACGLSRLCRERAHRAGAPDRVGAPFARLLPGVESIDRAGALASGARPTTEEQPVAEQLVRTAQFVEAIVPASALKRARRSTRP